MSVRLEEHYIDQQKFLIKKWESIKWYTQWRLQDMQDQRIFLKVRFMFQVFYRIWAKVTRNSSWTIRRFNNIRQSK